MARVKRGMTARRRRKKVMDRAEGFYSMNSRAFTHAKEKTDRAMVYSYRDRKVRKREFRALWITRIGAAARINGTSYSVLMGSILKSGQDINRKMLSEMAVHDPSGFAAICSKYAQAAV
jgi:large subunit ribosomal protein L20